MQCNCRCVQVDTAVHKKTNVLTDAATLIPDLAYAFWALLFYTFDTSTAELAPCRRKRNSSTRDPESHMSRYGEPCGGIHGYVRLEENCRPLAVLRVESVSGSATVRWRSGQGSRLPRPGAVVWFEKSAWLAFCQPRDLSLN
jgi:hypothetical protein